MSVNIPKYLKPITRDYGITYARASINISESGSAHKDRLKWSRHSEIECFCSSLAKHTSSLRGKNKEKNETKQKRLTKKKTKKKRNETKTIDNNNNKKDKDTFNFY